jgi:hypothetical protein
MCRFGLHFGLQKARLVRVNPRPLTVEFSHLASLRKSAYSNGRLQMGATRMIKTPNVVPQRPNPLVNPPKPAMVVKLRGRRR